MALLVNGKKVAGVGLPGKDGAPGADGKDGAPGKSAYQAAKEKGYTGTEEEFNTALAGMQSAPFLPLAGGVVTGNLILGVDSSSGSALYIGSENGAQVVFDSTWGLRVLADTIIFGQNSNDQKSLIFHNGQIKNLSLPGSPNDAANKQYVDDKAPKSITVTLTAAGWPENTQTVTVSGVLADEAKQAIQIAPKNKADADNWISGGLWCTAQGANSLTFTCDTQPTQDIHLNVMLQGVQPA